MALRLKRLRLRKNGPKRKRRLLSVRPVPTMITLGNLLCGFGAIVLAMRIHTPPTDLPPADCLYYAGLLIFVAMVFDALDGTVARWTNQTSRFGLEMDSLADVVTFGVAPAVIVKAAIDFFGAESFPGGPYPILDRYVWLMLAVYVACAALRLARYNVESGTSHSDFFFGMPSPGAAGCVASLMVMLMPVAKHLDHLKLAGGHGVVREKIPFLGALNHSEATTLLQIGLVILPFLMLCLGILMVSRVHYTHLGEKLLSGRRSFMNFLILLLAGVLIVMQHEIMLALAFNGYMLLGLVNEVRYQLFPSQRPKGWVASADEELHRLQEAQGAAPAVTDGAETSSAGTPDAPPASPAEPEANAHHAGD